METLRQNLARAQGSRLALVGLPWDGGSSFLTGSAQAPPRIRAALRSPSTNSWTENGHDLDRPGLLADLGDLDLTDPETAFGRIQEAAGLVAQAGLKPIFLGGDHSVTLPLIRALGRAHPGLSLLQIDAHPDLYDHLEGRRETHASPLARIMEEGLVERLVQVGVRTMNGHQSQQAERFGVEVFQMAGLDRGLKLEFQGPVYLTLDLDGLDPAFAPGVSHYEPGGLTSRQAIDLIQGFEGELVGADVVELNPVRDRHGVTAMVAAKLVKELAGRMLGPAGS